MTYYRFGFQGQEKNSDLSGVDGGHMDFKYRIHDSRLGRFLSMDPLAPEYPFYSPYSFSGNRVIDAVELEGAEPIGFMADMYRFIVGEERLQKSTTHQVILRTLDNTADRTDGARIAKNIATGIVNDPVGAGMTLNPIIGPSLMAKNFVDGVGDHIDAAKGNSTSSTQAEGIVDLAFDVADVAGILYGGAKSVKVKTPSSVVSSSSKLTQLQYKFGTLAESKLLPKFKALDPSLKSGYTGSFKTGKVGNPNKVTFGEPINFKNFDIDFYIESDILHKQYGSKLKADVSFRQILSDTPGFEGLKLNKKGFSIKFKPKYSD